jgi:hypothetical protein
LEVRTLFVLLMLLTTTDMRPGSATTGLFPRADPLARVLGKTPFFGGCACGAIRYECWPVADRDQN